MKTNTINPLMHFLALRPVFAPEEETGGGEAQENTGGDAGGEAQDTGIASADNQGREAPKEEPKTAVDGGTAEGQDNSGEEGEGDKPDGDEDGADVPETYEFKAPEGLEVDENLAEAISPVFKDMKLNQEQADKLVEAYGEAMLKQQQEYQTRVDTMIEGWVEAAKSDKEIGHNNWQSSVDAANAAIRKFGSKELIDDVLVGQAMGNHPEVIRLLARIGKAFSDDTFATGQQTDTGDSPAEARWYGDTTPMSKKG